jgi:hypothetical protein
MENKTVYDSYAKRERKFCIIIPLEVTLQVFMHNPAQLRNHDFHLEGY